LQQQIYFSISAQKIIFQTSTQEHASHSFQNVSIESLKKTIVLRVPVFVLCLAIPFMMQQLLKASEHNSRPLLVLDNLTFLPVSFSTRVFQLLKFSKA
jgi:hypothetical protein